jgi:hypothetical protein
MGNDIDLSNCEIYDIYGVGRKKLTGIFTKESLIELFCNEWITWVECHECGRADYCKYTEPHPCNPDRKMQIPCGVAVDSIKCYVSNTFPLLEKMNTERLQKYLDGSYFFSQFIAGAEQMVSMFIADNLSIYGSHAPALIGQITGLRDTLNKLASNLSEIPEFNIQRGVLFVEGQSEEAFLNKLKESHSSWFLHLIIENYEGEGNSKAKRIQMLLEDYRIKGYSVYIQGDADGKKNREKFNAFLKIVDERNMFIFRHDFETAVPPDLLLFSLQKLDCLIEITSEEFVKNVNSQDKSVVKIINESYGLDIEPLKIELAIMLARVLNKTTGWWSREEFMSTELGQFLRFIQNIR